ncbi:hypothetical protein PFY12_14715 [Chryseobacterium camelliae]|uniref:Uncharacterized protein n=1 Tax=Chryseobacterium camelliae TaxID=1265445 RepID=A0ABY7QNI4_9FLAO|nr:hypothetical protein [Chryseobacterium camelliae]WBV60278.1 hypothetical protein PFY12_14715 [Chryseobacterium camelliae]
MKTIDFNTHLFRCSQLGKLMVGVSPALTSNQENELKELKEKVLTGKITEKQIIKLGDLLRKRDEKPEISKSVETHLSDIHKGFFMKRDRHISNKFTEKGIRVEEKSITLYSDVKNTLFVKNQKHYSDRFKKGTPDNVQKKVRDMKSSWSLDTFPMYEKAIQNKDYIWQLYGYMDLTKIYESELVYALIDTPTNIIVDELRRLDWKQGIFDLNGNVNEDRIPLVVETVQNMIYTEQGLDEFCQQSTSIQKEWFTDFFEIPKELRIKVFELEYSKEPIQSLHEQITICRERLNGLTVEIFNHLFPDFAA